MRGVRIGALSVVMAMAVAGCGPKAGTLAAARETLRADEVRSIEFSGNGRWFQFGQAAARRCRGRSSTSAPTPRRSTTAPAARVQMTAYRPSNQDESRPAPVEQRPDQFVSGTSRGTSPLTAAAGHAPARSPRPQPSTERIDGDLDDAARVSEGGAGQQRHVDSRAGGGIGGGVHGRRRSRYVGTINAQNQVSACRPGSTIPCSVTRRSRPSTRDYRDFGGVMFPAHRAHARWPSGARAHRVGGRRQSRRRHRVPTTSDAATRRPLVHVAASRLRPACSTSPAARITASPSISAITSSSSKGRRTRRGRWR